MTRASSGPLLNLLPMIPSRSGPRIRRFKQRLLELGNRRGGPASERVVLLDPLVHRGNEEEVLRAGLRRRDAGEERVGEDVPQRPDTELIARLSGTVVVEQCERFVTLCEGAEDPADTTGRRLSSHPCRPLSGFMPLSRRAGCTRAYDVPTRSRRAGHLAGRYRIGRDQLLHQRAESARVGRAANA